MSKITKFTPQKIERLQHLDRITNVAFLDEPSSEHPEGLVAHLGSQTRNPEHEVFYQSLGKKLEYFLSNLPPQERYVVVQNSLNERSYESLAEEMGVGREAVRKIGNSGLKKLRDAMGSKENWI